MNILPKKRWHVRTRENIARVRKDEAEAAEEEKKRIQRIELAEKEARTELLRAKARAQYGYIPKPEKKEEGEGSEDTTLLIDNRGHVNLFYELNASDKTNADHEREAKEEREKEEKRVGYLTYLGQDTQELTGERSWYNQLPEHRLQSELPEVGLKDKRLADPMPTTTHSKPVVKTMPEKYITVPAETLLRKKEKIKKKKRSRRESSEKRKKKKRKRSHSSSSTSDSERKHKWRRSHSASSKLRKRKKEKKHKKQKRRKSQDKEKVDVEKLRAERLRREQVERQRAAALLARLNGEEDTAPPPAPRTEPVQKYNSQFNPLLARQNIYPQSP